MPNRWRLARFEDRQAIPVGDLDEADFVENIELPGRTGSVTGRTGRPAMAPRNGPMNVRTGIPDHVLPLRPTKDTLPYLSASARK
jgi:hypothetical protein